MRASYRKAIEWIALNDDAGSNDALNLDTISSYISVLLIADLFDVSPNKIARDVFKNRTKALSIKFLEAYQAPRSF